MDGCGSNTAAYQTIGGGSIGGQAIITGGYPGQGGGGIAAFEYEHPTTGKWVSKAEISLLLEEEDGRGLVSRTDREEALDLTQNTPEKMYPARDRWGTWKHEIRGYRLSLNDRNISELVKELKAKAKEEEEVGQQLKVTAITETLVGEMLSRLADLLDPEKKERFTELKNKLDIARRKLLKYTKKKMYKNYQEFEVLPQDLTRYFQKILNDAKRGEEEDSDLEEARQLLQRLLGDGGTEEEEKEEEEEEDGLKGPTDTGLHPPPTLATAAAAVEDSPSQGGGGKKRRSSKRRKVKRSVKRSSRRSTKRSTRRSMKRRSAKRSTRRRSMKRKSTKRSTRRRSMKRRSAKRSTRRRSTKR